MAPSYTNLGGIQATTIKSAHLFIKICDQSMIGVIIERVEYFDLYYW